MAEERDPYSDQLIATAKAAPVSGHAAGPASKVKVEGTAYAQEIAWISSRGGSVVAERAGDDVIHAVARAGGCSRRELIVDDSEAAFKRAAVEAIRALREDFPQL